MKNQPSITGQEDRSDPSSTQTSGLSPIGRLGMAILGLALLALTLPTVGHNLWQSIVTWLGEGEVPVTLPASFEVPYEIGFPDEQIGPVPLSGGFTTASFILSGIDDTSRQQLLAARVLTSLTTIALVIFILIVIIKVVRNRPVFRTLVRGNVICGSILIVGSLVASILTMVSLRSIAADLRRSAAIDSIFPEDVLFQLNSLAVCAGTALLILAIALRVAERNALELQEVI